MCDLRSAALTSPGGLEGMKIFSPHFRATEIESKF